MKKFEEEFDKNIDVFHVIGCHNGMCCSVKEVKVFAKDWVSPEDHQAEIAKLNSKIDWLHGLLDERNEEVVQTVKRLNEAQPEIPEVPQFVADWYEQVSPIFVEACIFDFILSNPQRGAEASSEFEKWFMENNNSIEILMEMKRLGYTVAKEKRFYLKNKLTELYLAIDSSTYIEIEEKWLDAKRITSYKSFFTQQEINSMETGSYEQIEVQE